MTFREQLVKLKACRESLEWVGNKSLEEVWKTCKNLEWMFWFLTKTDLDLTDPICDMAERVLDLVPEEGKLACIWAISAAKRRASQDELKAAFYAAYDAADAAYFAADSANFASESANAAADASSAHAAAADYTEHAISARYAARYAAFARYAGGGDADYRKEENKQCDIIRKYIAIEQVKEAFNKLVA
jgi:hypothetical protein